MSSPILATKLYIPPVRTKLVLRPRLIEQLNKGLSLKHRLTLISAPAGFGKTTLVSEWMNNLRFTSNDFRLDATNGGQIVNQKSKTLALGAHLPRAQVPGSAGAENRVAWLSLDEGDSDSTRFLTYFVTALQTVAPNVGEDVLRVLDASQPQPPSIESILTMLLNEITTIPDSFIFVLDDYHMLDSKSIDNALTFLLEHLPTQMHLVITTREDPNLHLARFRVRGQLTELRAADLRFTSSEAAEFLNKAMGLNLSAEDIAALEARTEGWIAGLQLAAIALQGPMSMQRYDDDAPSFIKSFTGTHHFVLDYLVEEVLQRQAENVQNFLLCTSILSRMCGALCDAVLLDPSTRGQETLEYLERANLFIIPLDNERRWYRYHHLFESLLRQRQVQSLTAEEIAKYHIRASQWYEKNGDAAEAFRHAITAQDFSHAAGLAEKYWQGMNRNFQSAEWLGWVKQIPEQLIRTRPVLCTQIAWAFMDASEVESSEARLRDAERCLEEDPSDGMVVVDEEQFRILPARIAFARAFNAQTERNFSDTVKYAELVIKLAPIEEGYFLRAQATAILGSTYWTNGDLDAACKSMSDWIDSSQKAGNFIFAIAGASGKADILTAQGHLREALRTYQQSLQLASAHKSEAQRVIAHHYLGLAMLYHEMGDEETSAQHFQKSLALGDQSTLRDWSCRRCLAQARLKESEGDLDSALDLLDEAKRLYVISLIPDTHPIDAIKARIHLKQGRLSKASEWVREHGFSADDDISYLREFEHITLAQVLVAEYQINREERLILEGLSLLERFLKAAEDQKRMGSMLKILMVAALAHHAHGSTSQAFASLEQSLRLAAPEGYFRIFVDEGEPMRSLLLDFRGSIEKQPRGKDHELQGYVNKLLSAFAQSEDIPQSNSNELLSQRELEVLRLIAQGLSNDEISQQLFLALDTVKGHNRRIYGKLQVQRRTEAIVRARELGLL